MALMALCVVLLLAGVAAVVLWGGDEVRDPPVGDPQTRGSAAEAARRYTWCVVLAVVAGLGAGVLAAGAGGRLAMRLLAATAGDDARGRETEADQIVGQISAGGTLGFMVFTALFLGVASGAIYLLIRRWLPDGRLGGLTYGLLLLVVAATRVDPLRADNPDFNIVGPGWVAATTFGALVVLHGMLVAALAARYSRALPLFSSHRRALLAHAPALALAPMAPALAALAIVGGLVVALRRRLARPAASLRSGGALLGGRLVLTGVGLVALPGCVSVIADIAARQP